MQCNSLKRNKYYLLLWLLILFISIVLRFWNLDDIPGPVFDEVYFPQYGYDYIVGKEFFHVHPPLANYIFAGSIWVYYHLPWTNSQEISSIPYDQLAAMSYRWINACFGVILTIIAWLTAYCISRQKWFALIVFILMVIDGSLLVDSRHGMNNIYLVLFGLLTITFAALSINAIEKAKKHQWLLLCGIFLGLTICVKWNGLGYFLCILAFIILYKLMVITDIYRPVANSFQISNNQNPINISIWDMVVYFIVTPIVVYCLLWVPDRIFNTEYSFLEIHKQILSYHKDLVGSDEHPYCSKWYTWPFMIRPVGYSFSTENIVNSVGEKITYYKDVHLFPNPAITWASVIAILVMIIDWIVRTRNWFLKGISTKTYAIITFLLLTYFANFLPWAFVKRCLFLYHYQSAATIGIFILAWYLTKCLLSQYVALKLIAISAFTLILLSFIYWLPFQLGIPLEQSAFYNRMWFNSWI
jgi:dolichyl-phosphate-mannose--protein O-mannosyl transferase